jgi:type IV pilus assembly protein PilX
MLTSQDQTNRSLGDERGAALVVSLVLLLIMTIIGISAMNGARLEVSMAGMMQREEVALRGAERTLTTAERYTENMIGAFDDVARGHYMPEDELDVSDTVWSEPDIVSLVQSDVPELSLDDEFVVEYLGEMTLPGSTLNDGGDAPIPGDKVNAYRITTRTETDGKAVRIVESIYTKLYNPMAP